LFAESSDKFLQDKKLEKMYPLWLHQMAEYLKNSSRCLNIVGHATPTERSKNAELPLLRAQKIQEQLQEHFLSVGEKSKIVSKGSESKNDRVVGFEVVDCSSTMMR
jgi:hypothetical protein